MVKEPKAGQVKTRLARGIGTVAATSFYRTALNNLVGRLHAPAEWTVVLAVAPDHAVSSPAFRFDTARVAQGRGILGGRLDRLMTGLPPGPVIIIGSDVPGITPSRIRRSFRLLAGADAVIGPSPDGGYWLIGLRRMPRVPRAFSGVRWSSSDARSDTLRNLAGLKIATTDTLSDVDTAHDFKAAGPIIGRRILPARG